MFDRGFQQLRRALGFLWILFSTATAAAAGARFTIASYNVENYLLDPVGTRPAKPADSRAKVCDMLLSVRPDILALQEMGDTNSLTELQARLKARGLDLPFQAHVRGYDTGIFVAVLTRFPIVDNRSHTNAGFLLDGRRFRTSRGIVEIDIQISPRLAVTLMNAHLKSRRMIAEVDENALRTAEAVRFRELVDEVFRRNAKSKLVICGDLNDHRDSKALQVLCGKGHSALVDTRPAEKNGDTAKAVNSRWEPRRVTWTHFYGKEDSYSRFDYILLGRGMARHWLRDESYVAALPDWGLASDHRPVVAVFEIPE